MSLDKSARTHVKPRIVPPENFTQIYRAAMSVRWDNERRSFYAVAGDLDQLATYNLILTVVKEEAGIELILSNETLWKNFPSELQAAIERERGKQQSENS
jgi:hypothetical protein